MTNGIHNCTDASLVEIPRSFLDKANSTLFTDIIINRLRNEGKVCIRTIEDVVTDEAPGYGDPINLE